jgi:predicted metal-dependent enzyme (double-stranded beta helix superfamily)
MANAHPKETRMTTLDQFAAECRTILKSEPGPSGRRKICMRLEGLLLEAEFIASNLSGDTPERQVLYEDPELGFCILAHQYKGAKDSPPHDHGPSWAIYGQARGETEMTDYALVSPASPGKPGKAKALRTYKLTPGNAYLYNEGDLHSPRRTGPTQLIRLEGMNMDRIKRLRFEAV